MWIIITSSVLILFAARLSFPFIALRIANKKLNSSSGYHSTIQKVRINLIGSEVILKGVTIDKMNQPTMIPKRLVHLPLVSIHFRWKELFKKTFIADIALEQPQFVIEKEPKTKADQNDKKKTNELKALMEKVIPFSINLAITDGTVHFDDQHSKTPIVMELTNIQCEISQFSNLPGTPTLFTQVDLTGSIYEGTVTVYMKVNPLAEQLTFDLSTEINNINLVLLNDVLRSRARMDVNNGRLSMSTKVSATSGEFKGYIQPIFSGLDLVGPDDKGDGLFGRLWEGFVALMIQALKNKRADQVAAKIPIAGKLEDPRINIVSAILTILKNGFIQSLRPSLDDVVDVRAVKSTFKRSKKFLRNKARLLLGSRQAK